MPGPLKLQVEELGTVVGKLPPGRQEFAKSLMDQFWAKGLSANQADWVEKLIVIAKTPEAPRETVEVGELSAMIAMFDKAAQKLKQPAIVLARENGHEIKLKVAGRSARVPGSINVSDNMAFGDGEWYGRILRDGKFEKSPRVDVPDSLVELLKRFAANPSKEAREFARLSGRCCFCNTALTDERSTSAGYGPTCARNWGLYEEWKAAAKAAA